MRIMKGPTKKVVGVTVLLTLISAFSTATLAEQTTQRDWSYSGLQFPGPARWGEVKPEYAACKTGQFQSPVNISSTSAQKAPLPQIEFQYAPTILRAVNTGYTTQVNPDKGSQVVIGGETYALVQYHFHAPSEEQIDGKSFAMTAHLVHQNASD